MKSLSHIRLLATPWTTAYQAPPSMGFSRQEYWSGVPLPSPYSGQISFTIDWFDLLAVQGTLKTLLQHHSTKASILQCSAFFMVQLSHPYMTIGKTIALTIRTFVGKVMSLLFNMLSRFVIDKPSKEQASFNFMAAIPGHHQIPELAQTHV